MKKIIFILSAIMLFAIFATSCASSRPKKKSIRPKPRRARASLEINNKNIIEDIMLKNIEIS